MIEDQEFAGWEVDGKGERRGAAVVNDGEGFVEAGAGGAIEDDYRVGVAGSGVDGLVVGDGE